VSWEKTWLIISLSSELNLLYVLPSYSE
jgi:hypothetical protein